MSFFKHPNALIESGAQIGANTRIWAFTHVLGGAMIGSDCNICDNVFIENQVIIGNRVTIKCGVQLWDGVSLEDDVFIGPNATFSNDRFPRSKKHSVQYPTTRVKSGASVGANATILPGVTIGTWALIGAGSVVTRNIPDFGLAFGNPARVQSWICQCGDKFSAIDFSRYLCSCGRSYQKENANNIRQIQCQ